MTTPSINTLHVPPPSAPAVIVPEFDPTDPASLEAMFGPFGHSENWRKTVLASCREIIRASSTLAGQKLSEARIDDLARLHDNYITFLTTHLEGRRRREAMALERIGL